LLADWRAEKIKDKCVSLAEWKKPDRKVGFDKKLFENYRDYLDITGEIREDRKEEFEMFAFLVDRVLTSVNAEINNYKGNTRKVTRLSSVFTASDEAFALLLVDNYWERWVGLKKDPGGKYPARYTSSKNGRNSCGYTDEGVTKYNNLLKMVKEKRKEDRTGKYVEQRLMEHWRGKLGSGQIRIEKEEVMGVVDLGDLFGNEAVEVAEQNVVGPVAV